MKFLSLRTVYRVFPIIKHSKTLGPRLVPTPSPIDLKFQASVRLIQDYKQAKFHRDWMRNTGEIEGRIRKNNNKKQNKNRKVFRRCRQTFNKKQNKKQKGLPTLSADLNNNKKQNKNRKVFRLCRQTLIKKIIIIIRNRTKTERSSDFVGRP